MARMHIAQSRTEEARQALAAALAQLDRQPPWHYQWSTAVLNLVDCACPLHELTACERLFELLLPHSGMMTWTVGASLGPYDLALGRLSLRRWESPASRSSTSAARSRSVIA